jgi:hypothetical protein
MNENDDFYSSIAPDVLRSLHRTAFFEKLDDLLSPRDNSLPVQECDNTFSLTESILPELNFDEADVEDILKVLRFRGACCDCEVLYNVAESSRLKAKYWRGKVSEQSKPIRHHPAG